ncbi:MAG: histidine phosphatase family protein [Vulcanimicrobiaceae bacterium]
MIVYVARHGETDWNREGRYQGQRESHLTARGRAQAAALARALEGVSVGRVVSSPLARCAETAEPIALQHRVALEKDARLIEIAHGTWEGRLRADIEREDPSTMRAWREEPQRVAFDGGESLGEVLERWRTFAGELAGNDDVLLVTHDVVVRLAILEATHRSAARLWEPRVVNGGYARFAIVDGIWQLLDECVDDHLGGLRVDTSVQAL